MASNIESYHLLQEPFGDGVEREEGIAVDTEKLALGRVGAAVDVVLGSGKCGIEAEEPV